MKNKTKRGVGRPVVYTGETLVELDPKEDATKLHYHSDRRKIVDLLVKNGGKMKLKDIEEQMGLPCKQRLMALQQGRWITIRKQEARK